MHAFFSYVHDIVISCYAIHTIQVNLLIEPSIQLLGKVRKHAVLHFYEQLLMDTPQFYHI